MTMEIVLVIMAVITALSPFLAYRKGIKDGQALTQGKSISPLIDPSGLLKPRKKPKLDETAQKALDYINSFKG